MNSGVASSPVIDFAARKSRGTFTLDVAFQTPAGITALFGPSGSGKTTVLHLIAGLLRPDAGRIAAGPRILSDTASGIFVPKHKRRVGLVFQDAQLFPHMTVAQNLAFGRWFAPVPHRALHPQAIIEALGISALLPRRPPSLSGGEKQRVALARAMLASPDVLLLDEPLAQLDRDRRMEILPLIERLRDEFAIPMLYVTHAADEAMRLAAHVVLLADGRVTRSGDPKMLLASVTDAGSSPGRDAFPSA